MTKASSVLLYYCTLFAVFISVSGFISAQKTGAYPFQLVFLPVTLYFLASSVRRIGGGAPDVSLSGRKTSLIAAAIIFLILLGIAIKNIYVQKSSPITVNNPQSTDKSNALVFNTKGALDAATLKSLVVSSDTDPLVNVRLEPSTSSRVIGTVKDGDEFKFSEVKGEWYEIVLEGGQTGYISKRYVKEVTE